MAIRAAHVLQRLEGTLGGPVRSDLDPYGIMNDAGHWLVNRHPWKWLERQQTPLDIVQDQPYITLPQNVREIIAFDATESLVNSITEASFAKILRLRTYQVDEQSFHFYGALEHSAPKRPNLLTYSQDFDSWTTVGAVGVFVNTGANPINGDTDADTIDDDDNGSLEGVSQVVQGHLLSAGIYVFSVYLKAGTASETDIQLIMDSGTEETTATITWGATPAISLGSSAGTGSHAVAIEQKHGGWVRASCALTWQPQEGTGAIECRILPAGTTAGNTGTCVAWGAQLERSLATVSGAIGGSGSNTGPTPYSPVLGAEIPVGGEPELQLGIWPIPNVSEEGKISMFYRGGFPRVARDSDYITIPEWFRAVYLETIICFARGWEEEDQASLNQRLGEMAQGPLLMAAIDADGRIQQAYGELEGGAAETGRSIIDWGLHTVVPDP